MIRLTDEEIEAVCDKWANQPNEDDAQDVFDMVAKAQLKKVVELLQDGLENDFVMAYADEDNPSVPTISPQGINELIEALLEEVK